eukprot:m51a1_g11970 hypothetical protein (407) ;mRNA; r:827079-828451
MAQAQINNMKRHDVQGNFPPDPPHMLPQAFGTQARMASFIESTRNPDPVIRLRAATEIAGALHREEDAKAALAEGDALLHALVELLSESFAGSSERSALIRAKAAESLATIALHPCTRSAICRRPVAVVPFLMDRLVDMSPAVRVNAYLALERLVPFAECADEAVRAGLLKRLVAAAYSEDAAVRERSLSCLHALASSSPALATAAVSEGAVRALVEVVGPAPGRAGAAAPAVDGAAGAGAQLLLAPASSRGVTGSQAQAARALLPIAATPEGRRDIVAHPSAVAWIASWLESAGAGAAEGPEERSVQTSSAALAACAALETSGKHALFEAGAASSLLAIVQHTSPGNPQLLYAVQAIACLAEAPAARTALKTAVPLLHDLERARTASDLEIRAAQRALQVITWTP